MAMHGAGESEVAADELPDHVLQAVADAVTPAELGLPGTASSELVHRVAVATYRATVAGPPTAPTPAPERPAVRYGRVPGRPAHNVRALADCCPQWHGEPRVIGTPGWLEQLALDVAEHPCTATPTTDQTGGPA